MRQLDGYSGCAFRFLWICFDEIVLIFSNRAFCLERINFEAIAIEKMFESVFTEQTAAGQPVFGSRLAPTFFFVACSAAYKRQKGNLMCCDRCIVFVIMIQKLFPEIFFDRWQYFRLQSQKSGPADLLRPYISGHGSFPDMRLILVVRVSILRPGTLADLIFSSCSSRSFSLDFAHSLISCRYFCMTIVKKP